MKRTTFRFKSFRLIIENERGSILLICFMALALLGLIGVMATTSSNTEIRIADNHKTSMQALYVAEAGIGHAKAVLKGLVLNDTRKVSAVFNDVFEGPDGDENAETDNGKLASLQNVAIGNGHYSVSLLDGWDSVSDTPSDGDSDGHIWQDNNNRVFIQSTGSVGKAQRVILVEFEITSTPLGVDGGFGIYTSSPIVDMRGSADVSGFNYDVPSNFNCSGAGCNGTLNPIDGQPPGIYSAAPLDFQTQGNAYSVDGSSCDSPYCPDSIKVGGGTYTNAYWVALANSLKPLATVTLDGTSIAGSGTLGTRTNPQITYITSEVTFSGSVDGAGILIIEDGIHFTGNSHYEGLVIVLTNNDDADSEVSWGTGNPDFFGAFIIAGNAPGIADLRGNPNIKYSRQALENIKNKFYSTKVLSWKDMAFD